MQALIGIGGFLLFIGLILIHEWGHYKAARRNGVEVEEFGLGFPPRAWGKKNKEGMILSINWLPLGGFVKLKGEHDADRSKGSFGAASTWGKTKIMLAGVTMNLIVALIMFTFLALTGMPQILNEDNTGVKQFTVASDTKVVRQEVRIVDINAGSPAAAAGLQLRDSVQAITTKSGESYKVKDRAELRAATGALAGQEVQIQGTRVDGTAFESKFVTLRTQSEVETATALYEKTGDPSVLKGYLGVIPENLQVTRATWSAPIVAVGLTGQLTSLTVKGIWTAVQGLGSIFAGLFTGNTTARQNGQTQATEQTGGIVAIVKIIWESGALGASFMLLVIAVVSLTLAIMNILPIPALDGGRLFVMLLFRGLKKPLTQTVEERIHGTGMAVLLTLFVLITIVDVKRFF